MAEDGKIRNTTDPKIVTPGDLVGRLMVIKEGKATIRMETGIIVYLPIVDPEGRQTHVAKPKSR